MSACYVIGRLGLGTRISGWVCFVSVLVRAADKCGDEAWCRGVKHSDVYHAGLCDGILFVLIQHLKPCLRFVLTKEDAYGACRHLPLSCAVFDASTLEVPQQGEDLFFLWKAKPGKDALLWVKAWDLLKHPSLSASTPHFQSPPPPLPSWQKYTHSNATADHVGEMEMTHSTAKQPNRDHS